jgi:hypothetical protein
MPLLLFILLIGLCGHASAVAKRIKAVENSLIPYVPVKGFNNWNILERIKHYGVPGVSIAVKNDYNIEWAKGDGLADTGRKIPVRGLKLNEYQATYLAYELMNRRNWDRDAVKTILELAQEQHPKSPVVYSRWAEFYLKKGDEDKAIEKITSRY